MPQRPRKRVSRKKAAPIDLVKEIANIAAIASLAAAERSANKRRPKAPEYAIKVRRRVVHEQRIRFDLADEIIQIKSSVPAEPKLELRIDIFEDRSGKKWCRLEIWSKPWDADNSVRYYRSNRFMPKQYANKTVQKILQSTRDKLHQLSESYRAGLLVSRLDGSSISKDQILNAYLSGQIVNAPPVQKVISDEMTANENDLL